MLGAVVASYDKSVPINTEIEDKKKKFEILILKMFWFGSSPSHKGCGGKGSLAWEIRICIPVGNLDFLQGGEGVGVFWNFGFGLRKKSWEFGFFGWGGGVFWNFGFGLRKKSWEFGFFGRGVGGVFWNFRFGLRKKSWEFGVFSRGEGILELRIWT